MRYRVHGFRHGDYLARSVGEYAPYWWDVDHVISSTSEEEVVHRFEQLGQGRSKSISSTLNALFKEKFVDLGWAAESPIFSEPRYVDGVRIFRLDFAKGPMSVEVAFNHGNDAPWNLLKPTLASELNHVEKAIQTDIGIIITATDDMRVAGGFDNAVGTFEKYVDFLKPMGMLLTAPLVIVGLEAPETFHVEHVSDGRRKLGFIVSH